MDGKKVLELLGNLGVDYRLSTDGDNILVNIYPQILILEKD